jgi:putative two-component system response regulator
VVDDEKDIREVMEIAITSKGHHCTLVPDGEAAIRMMRQLQPEVVITDVEMPNMDGIELTRRIKAEFTADVIILTGFAPQHAYAEFIEIGASDFVCKPVTPSEIIARLDRVLKERCLRAESMSAHQKLVAAHEELQESYLDTIHRLVVATEYKDEDTGDHIVRIGRLSALLAQRLDLPDSEVEQIGFAAPMHDIGKIGIPDKILLKPGKLSTEEFDIIKTHTTIGARILSKSKSDIIRCAQQIAVSHHERWDGSGYPQGLAGTQIPLTGRIVTLVDTFDALTSSRPYKEPYPLDRTLDIMRQSRGNHFDPELLDLFLDNIDDIVAIKKEVRDIAPGQLGSFLLSARDREEMHPQ